VKQGALPPLDDTEALDLIIVGGGPVGLLAGCAAADAGLRFAVLEASATPRPGSRAIGIHPPALQILSALGLLDEFLDSGVRIRRGQAFADARRPIGALDFGLLPPPHDFVLTVPQSRTEALLEQRLTADRPGAIVRGAAVSAISQLESGGSRPASITVQATGTGETPLRLRAPFVLGCDGGRSTVREALGIERKGGPYPHQYLMADFPEDTGTRVGGRNEIGVAELYLHPEGLVESFPLPGAMRRWVIELGTGTVGSDQGDLRTLVAQIARRCEVELESERARGFSYFEAERYLARDFHRGRVLLIGDAAHVVSPIGGQGMNLGWMNAVEAVAAIREEIDGREEPGAAIRRWAAGARRRSRRAILRAEQNMLLGHRPPFPRLRELAVRCLLLPPFQRILARRFTMGGL